MTAKDNVISSDKSRAIAIGELYKSISRRMDWIEIDLDYIELQIKQLKEKSGK